MTIFIRMNHRFYVVCHVELCYINETYVIRGRRQIHTQIGGGGNQEKQKKRTSIKTDFQ